MPVPFPLQNAYQPCKEVNRLLEEMGFMLRKGSVGPLAAENYEGPFVSDAFTKAIESQIPKSFEEGLMMALSPGQMGFLARNYRSPQAIRELRKQMAEEMRSRGPVGTIDRPFKTHEAIEKLFPAQWYGPEQNVESSEGRAMDV